MKPSRRSGIGLALVFALAGTGAARAAQHAHKPHAAAAESASPKQENQFVTVEEFVKGTRSARTPVSVEGYTLLGYKTSDGGLRLSLVDSVDHVLSAKDADGVAKSGAVGLIPSAAVKKHASWGWVPKGVERFTMYSGAGHAQKALHDSVTKMRLTGYAIGKVISPVTKVEYQDENGDWKTL